MVGADGRKFLKSCALLDCLKLAFFKAFNQNLAEPVNLPFALKKIWSGPRPGWAWLAPAASASFDLTYRDGEEKDMRRRRIFTTKTV